MQRCLFVLQIDTILFLILLWLTYITLIVLLISSITEHFQMKILVLILLSFAIWRLFPHFLLTYIKISLLSHTHRPLRRLTPLFTPPHSPAPFHAGCWTPQQQQQLSHFVMLPPCWDCNFSPKQCTRSHTQTHTLWYAVHHGCQRSCWVCMYSSPRQWALPHKTHSEVVWSVELEDCDVSVWWMCCLRFFSSITPIWVAWQETAAHIHPVTTPAGLSIHVHNLVSLQYLLHLSHFATWTDSLWFKMSGTTGTTQNKNKTKNRAATFLCSPI